MPRKFKIRAGKHVQDGRTFNKGDVVLSSHNLTKMFKEKFDDVGEATEEEVVQFASGAVPAKRGIGPKKVVAPVVEEVEAEPEPEEEAEPEKKTLPKKEAHHASTKETHHASHTPHKKKTDWD